MSRGPRLPGLRWVPVPLAVLAAALGWMVLGGAMGQHAEVNLGNATSHAQRYALGDFKVVAPDGRSWKVFDDGANTVATTETLEPGFEATVNMYFDIPTAQSTNLSIEWSRGGTTVDFPVNTSGKPSLHIH